MHGVLRKKKYCYIIFTGSIFGQKNKKNPDARQPFGSACQKKGSIRRPLSGEKNASAEFATRWNAVKNQCGCGERSNGMTCAVAE